MMRIVTNDLRFLIFLACSLVFLPAVAVAAAAEGFAFQEQPGKYLDVDLDGRTVARFMTAYDPDRLHETYKPFLHVMDAKGEQPITKGPGGQFSHHRGIFIGWSRLTVDGQRYDLWHMSGGSQIHQEFLEQEAGQDQASFTAQIDWKAKDGETLLTEQRTFIFHRQSAPVLVQVDVISKLTPVAGDTLLNGDPEHAGVQYRPANEVDRKQTRYLFPAEDNDPRQDKDLPWVGETYVLHDKTYSVVQMNHPDNPDGSIWSAYRDYGRFGVFPKVEVKQGDTLTLRYRFRVMTGELPDREQVRQWWDDYAGK
jgi:hypothetical protein